MKIKGASLKAILLLLFVSCKEVSRNLNNGTVNVKKSNIVMILADDMRLDYLGAMGMNSIVKTPNLDKLALEGSLFKNAFVTSSICMPSRTTILSGQYERKHGVTFGANSAMTEFAWSKTYPMLLRENGYYTGWIGKNHTPIGKSEKGFGYKSGIMEKSFDFWYAGHGHISFYPKEKHNIFRYAKEDNQIDIIQEGVDNFIGTNDALVSSKTFLKSRPNESPFCLMINFNVPHSNSTNSMEQRDSDPELYTSAFRGNSAHLPLPKGYVAKEKITKPKLPKHVYSGEYLSSYDWVSTEEKLKENQIRTLQTVAGIDKVVGKIIDGLEAQGELDNTLIIFTSDHGLFHGEFGLGGKTLLYDTALRIPLIIKAPGRKKVQTNTIEQLALTIDIAPTILDYAGIKIPSEMQGKSMRRLLEGKKKAWRKEFFCENMFMGQGYPRMEGVRTESYKYIRYFSKDKDQHHLLSLVSSILGEQPIYEELYDLKKDPEETENLASNDNYEDVLENLRKRNSILLIEAKEGNQLPNTYIKNIKNSSFKTEIQEVYNNLPVSE